MASTPRQRTPAPKQGGSSKTKPNIGVVCNLSPSVQVRIPKLSLEALAIHANRLLKLKFPPRRNREAILKLLKRIISPSNKRQTYPPLDSWPTPWLEQLHYQVWIATLGLPFDETTAQDRKLNQWVTLLDCQRCKPSAWLAEICQDALLRPLPDQQSAIEGMSFSRLQGSELAETLRRLAKWHGLSSYHYKPEETETVAITRFLQARSEHHPLPWASLLAQCSEDEPGLLEDLTGLNCLQQVADSLLTEGSSTRGSSSFWLNTLAPWPTPYALPKVLVLVEGTSEAAYLPAAAKALGFSLKQQHVTLVPVGGKANMGQHYQQWAHWLACPIVTLLDEDAAPEARQLRKQLRPGDALVLLEEGALEATYHTEALCAVINRFEAVHPKLAPLTLNEICYQAPVGSNRVEQLRWLWQQVGLGRFDKTLLARAMAQEALKPEWVSEELQQFFTTIKQVRQTVND